MSLLDKGHVELLFLFSVYVHVQSMCPHAVLSLNGCFLFIQNLIKLYRSYLMTKITPDHRTNNEPYTQPVLHKYFQFGLLSMILCCIQLPPTICIFCTHRGLLTKVGHKEPRLTHIMWSETSSLHWLSNIFLKMHCKSINWR